MTGEVKSFNPSTRYGFITDGHVDFRFHIQDWDLRLPPARGLKVEFLQTETEKGFRATNIKLCKGEEKHGKKEQERKE